MPIFALSAGVLFDGAFSLWVSLRGKSTLANSFINHIHNFHWLELENCCNNNIYSHKIYKHTQWILHENSKQRRQWIYFHTIFQSETKEQWDKYKWKWKNALYKLRRDNCEGITINHININSIKNKFDFLTALTKNEGDILIILETKLDSSFPQFQFCMSRFYTESTGITKETVFYFT